MSLEHAQLSIRRQCKLLSLPRSTQYYAAEPPSPDDLELMRTIDALYLKWPFYGSRRMAQELAAREHQPVNRKRVQRLMRLMGIEGLSPRRSTSRPHVAHEKFPYLLRNLLILQANQVWAADITYIPLDRGFVYLVAVIDWFSRMVLAWRLSNTLDSSFCVDALDEALRHWKQPLIFNTDQGAQFTSEAFLSILKAHGIRISMDGKGRYKDNIFVERLWRSLKYEEVYLKAYSDVPQSRDQIGEYFRFYNHERRHQALNYQTPASVYYESVSEHAA